MSPPVPGIQKIPERKPHKKFKGHTGSVWGVIHLPGRKWIITCSQDGSLRLWNMENGLQIGKDWQDGESRVHMIALSPDKKTVVSGSGDHAVRLWDIETGKMIAKWTGHSEDVRSVCWSQGGQRVVSGSFDGTARVWDVKSGKTVLGPINTGQNPVIAAVYSPDETIIATGGRRSNNGREGFIKIWDAKSFELVTTLNGHTDDVWYLAWTADGKTLVSGSLDNSIIKWNTTTWKQLAVLTEHTDGVSGIAISPNSRILASASYDKTARLWNLESGQPINSPLLHADELECISFSADGQLLATGCDDKNAYTWDVSAIVKEAGFGHLLLDYDDKAPQDPARKSVLDAEATRPLAKPFNNTRRLPQRFFDDTGGRIPSSSTGTPACQSSPLRPRGPFDRFSSLFRRSRPAVRDATLHNSESCPPEVEVPYTRGQARNVTVIRQPKNVPVPGNAHMMIDIPGTPRPVISDVAQPSNEPHRGHQSSSQPQDLLTTGHAGAVTTITSAGTPPDIVNRQAGCWTHFWHFLCCNSSEGTADSQ